MWHNILDLDIPIQRKACHEFANRMGWEIVGEEQETGISGYKVSANDRDKLQLIKKYAEQGKFDILLVFIFDRLGRKSDETPFVVEWFVLYNRIQKENRILSAGSDYLEYEQSRLLL